MQKVNEHDGLARSLNPYFNKEGLEVVLGVMNLLWNAALAAFVLMEKVIHNGHLVSRVTGLLLAGWGVWMVAAELV